MAMNVNRITIFSIYPEDGISRFFCSYGLNRLHFKYCGIKKTYILLLAHGSPKEPNPLE
jgi:hypothetical protein